DDYVFLEEMPLTPNGKVDRKALPLPEVRNAAYEPLKGSVEEITAECFARVLNIPLRISAIDEFFALGGDSIKAIRLVSMMRQKGLSISVSEVMKHRTVRAVAAAALWDNGKNTISQDALEGEIRSNGIISFFAALRMPHASHFNQSFALRCRERVDRGALEKVLGTLTTHHDMLRAVLKNGQLCVKAVGSGENHYTLEECSVSDHKELTCYADHLQRSIDLEEGPILKAGIFHLPGEDILVLICHHIAVDGISWRILLEDLEKAYAQAATGGEIRLPRKTHSFGHYTEALFRYRDSYLLLREKSYWKSVQSQLEKLPQGGKIVKGRRAYTEKILTSSAVRHLITDANRAYHTEVNDLLITAYAEAYRRVTGKDGCSINMEGHGREELHEPVVIDRTVGWFTSVYPVVISGLQGELRYDIRLVKETLRAVPNKGMGYGVLQWITSGEGDENLRTDLIPELSFNYLGEFAEGGEDPGMFRIAEDVSSGTAMNIEGFTSSS
ncbi:MAG: hypothetical protein HUJ73_02670, partial [Eubacterium sp.]|nr:hypothetical protein [Eubacterium sp.]